MTSATTVEWQIEDVLDAAVLSLINARCRSAYVHDLRGALQSVQSSVQLLSRAAKRAGVDEARMDSVAALAKRAMSNQEHTLMNIVEQITMLPGRDEAVELKPLLEDAQQFLRNDTAHKDILFEIHAEEEITVVGPRARMRSLLVGLFALCLDEMPAGASLRIDLTRDGDAQGASDATGATDPTPAAERSATAGIANIDVRSGVTWGPIQDGRDLLRGGAKPLRAQDLVLSALRRLTLGHNGSLAVLDTDVLRIRWPLAGA